MFWILLSFFASLCLHLLLFIAVLFWPPSAPLVPPPPAGILIDGLVSVNPLPGAPVRNARQDLPPPPPVSTAQIQPQPEREQPAPPSVQTRDVPHREEAQPSQIPPPSSDPPVIPRETQRAANATPPVVPARNATRTPPPSRNATRRRPAENLNDALADMARQARRPPSRGEDLSSALADLSRELGGSGQASRGGGSGIEGGSGMGIAGAYADSVASRIKPNWAMAERADRTNYVAVASLSINPDGVIQNAVIKTPSGNGLFDASILQAIRATRQVEAPPGVEFMNLDITFSREALSRR